MTRRTNKKTKKIAIIGTTISLHDAPYGDPSWEIWGLNGAYIPLKEPGKRWDRWFEFHSLEIINKHHDPAYKEFLNAAGDKLMMKQKYDEFPKAKVYPLEDMIKEFDSRYFNNTVAFLIAKAISEGATEIGIWGVNMACETEYAKQRPCVDHWLGIAKGAGVKITIPDTSELLKCSHIYSFDVTPDFIHKISDKTREIDVELFETKKVIERIMAHINCISGQVNAMNDFKVKYLPQIDKKDKALAKSIDLDLGVEYVKLQAETIEFNKQAQNAMEKEKCYKGAKQLQNYYELNWIGKTNFL